MFLVGLSRLNCINNFLTKSSFCKIRNKIETRRATNRRIDSDAFFLAEPIFDAVCLSMLVSNQIINASEQV